jgi:hypothetical protein
VASVRRCIDCEVMLVDEVTGDDAEAAVAPAAVGDGERVSYELEHWGNQLKVTLEGMLDRAGIRHVWEVGALVVSADDVEAVEGLIATVEGRDVDDFDDVEEQIAFEIEGIDAEAIADLDARLIAAGIDHAWSEEGELLVALEHEDEVTSIIEAVVEGDDDADDHDGLAANQALSELFVVVDRLVKAPTDGRLADKLEEAARALEPLGVPYGFAAQEWADLKADVAALVAAARGEEVDDDVADAEIVDEDGEVQADDGDEDADAETTEADRLAARAEGLREQLLAWI